MSYLLSYLFIGFSYKITINKDTINGLSYILGRRYYARRFFPIFNQLFKVKP
ncbi:hypothetical protein ACFP3I_08950 [Chryseobacterium arachidis]|uniref:hypothetical protein n=1 Tax=Chryseobacterium arachidis TaxID=1416778 RepID=UPI00360ABCC6